MEEIPSFLQYLIVVFLLSLSALFSGLTLGLMGLSSYELKRKAELGDADADKVYKIRKRGNLLLTALLLGNVAVNAVLSIFLGSLTSGVLAAVIATGLIVIFGEIIPQAIFSRFALKLGARFALAVRVLLFVLYPVIAPIAFALDKILGEELPTIYSKKELIKLIEEHEDAGDSEIDEDEERILKGALTFSEKLVKDVMTPETVIESYNINQKIDKNFIKKVKSSGFSRLPIFDSDNEEIVGILHAIDLIGLDGEEKKHIKDMPLSKPEFINENEALDDALNKFLKSHKHLFIVKNEFGTVTGVLSLEDIVEEILEQEIVDERDKHEDLREFARLHSNQ